MNFKLIPLSPSSRFTGFGAHSAIDTLLTVPGSPQASGKPSTPAPGVPAETLDKLLEEDDLLQEVKNQHEKLFDFLGRKDVASRLLGYINGEVSDAEDAEQKGKGKAEDGAEAKDKVKPDDLFSTLLNSTNDVGAAERRRVRNPYLCAEILASDVSPLLDCIFENSSALLSQFWDHVLDQPAEDTAAKPVQLGYWARANGVFFNKRMKEMLAFVKSRPRLIERLLAHFGTSPVVDVLTRIIQCEAEPLGTGTLDWLAGESLVPRLVALLSPSTPPELHAVVSDFLKNVITFCTNPHVVGGAGGPPAPAPGVPPPSVPGQPPSSGPRPEEARPKFLTTRLMRELASEDTVALMMEYGLDEFPIPDVANNSSDPGATLLYPPTLGMTSDSLPNAASATSSLIHCLSVLIDLIRRNNSDFIEQEMLQFYRRQEQDRVDKANESDFSEFDGEAESAGRLERPPSIVPLGPLLSVILSRLGTLQSLMRCPRSVAYGADSLPTTVGPIGPLTLERYRICELYAELLHCSNMALLNRPPGTGPVYDEEGFLQGGKDSLAVLEEALSPAKIQRGDDLDESCVVREALPSSPKGQILNLAVDAALPARRPSANARDPNFSPPQPGSPFSETSETPSEQASIDSETGVLTRSEAAELKGILEESELEPFGTVSPGGPKRANWGGAGTPHSRVGSTPSSRRYSVPLVNYAGLDKGSRHRLSPGDSLKAAFQQHQVLETCIDLFFTYPWHNFLHNVIYDIVQQIFQASMEQEGSLALAQTLLINAALIEKILQGDSLNTEVTCVLRLAHARMQKLTKSFYSTSGRGARLGYMGHMILMADEVAKALRTYPTELGLSAKATDSIPQPAWDDFVKSVVRSSTEQAALPLGGSVPIVLPEAASSTSDSDDDVEFGGRTTSGWGDPMSTSAMPTGGFGPGAATTDGGKNGEFARYLVSQINSQTGDRFSSSGSEDSDEEEGAGWVRSSGFASKDVRSNTSAGGEKSFGFDDRFDSPARGFGHRFDADDVSFEYLLLFPRMLTSASTGGWFWRRFRTVQRCCRRLRPF